MIHVGGKDSRHAILQDHDVFRGGSVLISTDVEVVILLYQCVISIILALQPPTFSNGDRHLRHERLTIVSNLPQTVSMLGHRVISLER